MTVSGIVIQAVAGVALFWFGLHILSENIQLVSGKFIRKTLNSLSNNRLGAVLVGVVVAIFVQSSAVTSVTIVSFANAGLMSLAQGLAVIVGINFGSSLTALLISLPVAKYIYVFYGLGIFILFILRSDRLIFFGRLVFSFGLVFHGLTILDQALGLLSIDGLTINEFEGPLFYLTLFVAIAATSLVTLVFKSGVTVLSLAMILFGQELIDAPLALAMIAGLNLGTALVALMASHRVSVTGRRVAFFHFVFNLILAAIVFFFVDTIAHWLSLITLAKSEELFYWFGFVPVAHLLMNLLVTVICLSLLSGFETLLTKIVPDQKKKEPQKLKYLGHRSLLSPTMAIELSYQELKKMAAMLQTLLSLTRDYLSGSTHQEDTFARIKKYENITNNIQAEINDFLVMVIEARLVPKQSQEVRLVLKLVDELESVANECASITDYRRGLFEKNIVIETETLHFLELFSDLLMEQYEFVFNGFASGLDFDREGYDKSYFKFANMARDMGQYYFQSVKEAQLSLDEGLALSEISINMKEIRNHVLKIRNLIWKESNQRVEVL